MIKIKRPKRPAKLANVRTPRTSVAYRSPEVRGVLWKMQHEKCCYCEVDGLPQAGAGAAVEHFWPQGKYPGKTNVWSNLLLICPACNGRKLDDFPLDLNKSPVLINPASPDLDPEDHFEFEVDLKGPELGGVTGITPRGDETVRIIRLDTRECVLDRVKIIIETYADIAEWKKRLRNLDFEIPGAQAQVTIAKNKLLEKAKNYSPYAATVRKIYRDFGIAHFVNDS